MKNKKIYIYLGIVLIVIGVVFAIVYLNQNKQTNFCQDSEYSNYNWDKLDENYKEGLGETLQKLCDNPESVSDLVAMASYFRYNGDYDKALEVLDKAIDLKPEDVLPRNNKMSLLYDLKRYDEAEQVALDVVEVNSQWFNAYQMLRDIYKYQKKDIYQTDKFPNLILRAIELDALEENINNYNAMLGGYYQDIGNNEKAIEYYEKVYEATPEEYIQNQIDELKK